MRGFIMNKFWKTIFYIFSVVFILALGLQIYEYEGMEMIKVISLDATWRKAKQALV
jgi:hypothetical protein